LPAPLRIGLDDLAVGSRIAFFSEAQDIWPLERRRSYRESHIYLL
jgi:hypothetical protein